MLRRIIRKALNVKPASGVDSGRPTPVSSGTYDILIRAADQGHRIEKIEDSLQIPRTGNPFGDILEKRVDERLDHAKYL